MAAHRWVTLGDDFSFPFVPSRCQSFWVLFSLFSKKLHWRRGEVCLPLWLQIKHDSAENTEPNIPGSFWEKPSGRA